METILLCSNIYKIRLEKNYSQEYMAIQLVISQSQYSKLERGQQELSFERIVKIAEIFSMEVKDLLEIQ